MRSYSIELPRGVIVDVFNLPKDFEEQIIESFKGYTEETAKEYRYCDKLGYIDCCVQHLNGDKRSYDIVNKMVEDVFFVSGENTEKSLRKMIFTVLSLWKSAMTEEKKMQGCIHTSAVTITIFTIRFRKCL